MIPGPKDNQLATDPAPVDNSLFRHFVEDVDERAVFFMATDGVILTWNKSAEGLLGFTPDEVIGTSFVRFFTPEDGLDGRPEQKLQEAMASGRASAVGRMVRKDGSFFWGRGLVIALSGADGRPPALVATIQDITAERQVADEQAELRAREVAAHAQAEASEKLRQANERFRLLVESVKDYAIFLLDPRGHVLSWNEGARRIKGYTEEEILGKSFEIFYTPEDRARGVARRGLKAAAAHGRYEIEGWRVRKDGSRFWADVVITALRDQDGRLIGFAKVTRDLTERRNAEREHLRLVREETARKEAERAQREINDILERITDAFYAVDREWRMTYVNQKAQDFFGRSSDQLVGKVIWKVIPNARGTNLERELRQALHEGRPVTFETVYPLSEHWIEVRAYPNETGLSIYFSDITMRKQAEEVLLRLVSQERTLREAAERREAELAAVIESVPDAIYIGTEAGITTTNQVGLEMLGYDNTQQFNESVPSLANQINTRDAATGRPILPGDQPFEHALRGEKTTRDVLVQNIKTGREVIVRSSAAPIRLAEKIIGAVAINTDMTDQVKAAHERDRLLRQLASERNWLRVVIERSPIGILLVEGTSGERVVANQRAEDLFGRALPAEGGIDQYVGQVHEINGRLRPRIELATTRALRGETVSGEEELLRRPSGKDVRVRVSAVPIHEDGQITGAIVAYEDITQIRELERLHDEWISMISHDLRQPVTAIIAYAGLVRRTASRTIGEQERSALDHVITAAWNLNKMVGDLLEASRIEAKRLTLDRETVDLRTLVEGIAERASASTAGHEVRIQFEGAIPRVTVDPVRIEQVLGNLLSNAAKYSFPQSDILVKVERKVHYAEISVTNAGPGISTEEMRRLFNRFYRTRSATAGQITGLGLGLFISRGIVEAHGGRIWAVSVPDQTTTFHFTVPISDAELEAK